MKLFHIFKGKILLFIAIFGLTFGIGAVIGGWFHAPSVATKASRGENINILLMGIDARDTKSNSRSDTMIVASINTKSKKAVLVSVPRDTRVKTSKGYVKINSINLSDGPDAACEEVGKILGINVDKYVVTNFSGFGKIVNTLGGVYINVESDMHHSDTVNPELAINISKGYQYLNGQQALAYVRYRGGPTADIGRTQRQQQFIKAVMKEMLKPAALVKLPKLIPEIAEYVHTNISLSDMVYLAQMAKDFNKSDSLITQTLPGYPFTDPDTGESFWEVDHDEANGIIAKLLNGEKFSVVSDPPEWLTKQKHYKALPVKDLEEIKQEVKNQEDQQEDDTAVTEDKSEDSSNNSNDTQNTEQNGNNPDNSSINPGTEQPQDSGETPSTNSETGEQPNTASDNGNQTGNNPEANTTVTP